AAVDVHDRGRLVAPHRLIGAHLAALDVGDRLTGRVHAHHLALHLRHDGHVRLGSPGVREHAHGDGDLSYLHVSRSLQWGQRHTSSRRTRPPARTGAGYKASSIEYDLDLTAPVGATASRSPSLADLTFLGAAQTVTGSKHLLTTASGRQVLVDCGQFQGSKVLRERNWQAMPFRPSGLDAVVLTHAHLDHCGMLPRLVAAGFTGRIFCTPGTRDLCSLVLPDAGRIQEEDARQANKHGYTRHRPALPLFTEADALRALTHLQPVGYGVQVPVADGVDVEFLPAGHLLGSAFVRMTLRDDTPRTLLFGGDLGRYDRPILPDPTAVPEADVLLVESTYGDRRHPPDDDGAQLAEVIGETWRRGGKLVIPSFAIGRAGELLYWIDRLEREKRIPTMPV